MNHHRKLPILGLLLVASLFLTSIDSIDSYIAAVKTGSATSKAPAIQTVNQLFALDSRELRTHEREQELLERIRAEAKAKYIPPVNAKVDSVWKAIPGYNGVEVDIDQTFLLAKSSLAVDSQAEIPWVMKEVDPSVQLEDLGAQPIYKGNPNKPMAALMINVAWGNEYIPSILETLRKEQVKATFFFDGSWLNKNVETAKLIQAEGHEMSNHAYSHKDMSKLGPEAAREEIRKTEVLLREKLQVNNTLFAPPSGDFNMQTVRIAHELKLKTVLWTIDTVDWKKPDPSWIQMRISSRIEPGAMILMHPTSSSSRALPGMIQTMKQRGLTLGTVSELLSPKRVPSVEPQGKF
ncbi:polysaccharide deacetylase family protein [Paenibacillus sp. y28]|uniref:polysaccharide deacetylase family protein n=1 Tax=Paenibacillus sp. y28 TaxID=3129110 RepID=UPI0030189C16